MAAGKSRSETQLYFVGALAWLIPGAGHWILGARGRAVAIFVGVVGTFVLGLAMGSVELIDPAHARAWFAAQILNGVPAIMATLLQGKAVGVADISCRAVDWGQLYTGMAGLLNLLCIVDSLYRAHLVMAGAQESGVRIQEPGVPREEG